ncbi:hypothetical protein F2P81_007489 [Scophthalmus maximus]|uniref:Transposase Tc1-like domain-containing protein n=1 Tax=Scophthalmus maximus TaxID=52904 RepID=A0A6A4T7S1_SCOMX|nr:hypothetical protein F2P81_007489 [Scophthalmus maximus]
MRSNQNRKRSGRPRCTTEQEDKYIRVSSLRNRHLTGPQLAASLNGTRKTPVSSSTEKRRLQDTGLLGRVTKGKKTYVRLANKRKRLRWAEEQRHWTEEDWEKAPAQSPDLDPIELLWEQLDRMEQLTKIATRAAGNHKWLYSILVTADAGEELHRKKRDAETYKTRGHDAALRKINQVLQVQKYTVRTVGNRHVSIKYEKQSLRNVHVKDVNIHPRRLSSGGQSELSDSDLMQSLF